MSRPNQFRPRLEGFEDRLVPAAPVTAPLAAVMAGDGTTTAAAETATVNTLAVVSIINTTAADVTFEFRWAATGTWVQTTLAPGREYVAWTPTANTPRPQIRFGHSFVAGIQNRVVNLQSNTWRGAGTPPAEVARVSSFVSVAGGLNVIDGRAAFETRYAVLRLANDTTVSHRHRFRWNDSAAWQDRTLAPGKTWFYYIPVAGAAGPEVRFDSSTADGWQPRAATVSYNTVTRTTAPLPADAKTFSFVAEGDRIVLRG